jgi:hypothetical protein
LGGFISVLFTRFKNFKHLYTVGIPLATVVGYLLIYHSSSAFASLYAFTGWEFFGLIPLNNYLFIRLGNVFMVFAVFMLLRRFLTNRTILNIGASTLSIYVIHFIILYGSFTGLGLYRFFNHSLTPQIVIPGAILFMVVCTYLALKYNRHEAEIKSQIAWALASIKRQAIEVKEASIPLLRELSIRARLVLRRFLRTVRG